MCGWTEGLQRVSRSSVAAVVRARCFTGELQGKGPNITDRQQLGECVGVNTVGRYLLTQPPEWPEAGRRPCLLPPDTQSSSPPCSSPEAEYHWAPRGSSPSCRRKPWLPSCNAHHQFTALILSCCGSCYLHLGEPFVIQPRSDLCRWRAHVQSLLAVSLSLCDRIKKKLSSVKYAKFIINAVNVQLTLSSMGPSDIMGSKTFWGMLPSSPRALRTSHHCLFFWTTFPKKQTKT